MRGKKSNKFRSTFKSLYCNRHAEVPNYSCETTLFAFICTAHFGNKAVQRGLQDIRTRMIVGDSVVSLPGQIMFFVTRIFFKQLNQDKSVAGHLAKQKCGSTGCK